MTEPAQAAIERARANGWRIAVAESLTGGLLADALVRVPGASRAFSGAIVSYDTALKQSLLGVDARVLATKGPVDELVALQMAAGVRRACAVNGVPATIGIATTGVAGPDPDPQTGQAPGAVWLGVSSPAGERAVLLSFTGDRAEIRAAAVEAALGELVDEVLALSRTFPAT